MARKKLLAKTLQLLSLSMLLVMPLATTAQAAGERDAFLQAFERSYENPGSTQAALKYAQEAVKIGDYEAAIPPLERVLMFNPKLSEVRLEVGVLYYLLNSKDMAKMHLNIVTSDAKAAKEVKSRARSYLAKL